jgi:hypothetical protein
LFESAIEVSSGENLLQKPVFMPRPLVLTTLRIHENIACPALARD